MFMYIMISTMLIRKDHNLETLMKIIETLVNGLKEFFIDSERR